MYVWKIDDPLANDVAQHWKDNEKEAIATGGCFLITLFCLKWMFNAVNIGIYSSGMVQETCSLKI